MQRDWARYQTLCGVITFWGAKPLMTYFLQCNSKFALKRERKTYINMFFPLISLFFFCSSSTIYHHPLLLFHCIFYIQLYVQARLAAKWARLLRPTIQFFLVAFAVYVGYTRVSDYKHHWSDVLVGLLQGALIAILNVSPYFHPMMLRKLYDLLSSHWDGLNIVTFFVNLQILCYSIYHK